MKLLLIGGTRFLGRHLAEDENVQQLGEERSALEGIAHDHIHHLIVARVAQRLGINAVHERRG